MPKVSINILTKDRLELLKKALASVWSQTFTDFEVVVVNDGSADQTEKYLKNFLLRQDFGGQVRFKNLKILNHKQSLGITKSRQEALSASSGEYVAFLDDDDQWIDQDKLKKQVEFLDSHPEYVLVGGSVSVLRLKSKVLSLNRPLDNKTIRRTMLLRNNFFTSTVMVRRQEALQAGGFASDSTDLAEDYDLWLRIGLLGKMANFADVFALYRKSDYNKYKLGLFFDKQSVLIRRYKKQYPLAFVSGLILKFRKFIIGQ